VIYLAIARVIVVGVYELAHEIWREVQRDRARLAVKCKVIDLQTVRAARRAR
jgi:hypothetical protein